jgi:excinuclease ABC subunit B
LIAILDADKQGFLRSEKSLIQTIGRCARNVNGHVIMYADKISDSMKKALEETERRRNIQDEYNQKHNIIPQNIKKEIRHLITNEIEALEKQKSVYNKKEKNQIIDKIEKEMIEAAKQLDFERATELRDILFELKLEQ